MIVSEKNSPIAFKMYIRFCREILSATINSNKFNPKFIKQMLQEKAFTEKEMIAINNIHREWVK